MRRARCTLVPMSEDEWRPLGFETDGAAAYDALHDGIPTWMSESFWAWMRLVFTYMTPATRVSRGVRVFDVGLLRDVERVCRFGTAITSTSVGESMRALRLALTRQGIELRVADYCLTRKRRAKPADLEQILLESGSLWKVGTRVDRPGLVRRVPEGAQINANAVIASSKQAGARLAQAWDRTFGTDPDPSAGYALAVRAVEDAAIPVVVPRQDQATLSHVIGKLRADADWGLPLSRESADAPTAQTILRLCQALWKGHHDRHGGGNHHLPEVTQDEAEVATTIAVTLVQWFSSGMVARR